MLTLVLNPTETALLPASDFSPKNRRKQNRTFLTRNRWQQAKTNIDEKNNIWNNYTISYFLQ